MMPPSLATWPQAAGQRKTIAQRSVAGEPAEVAAICRIFREFVDLGYSTTRIAEGLNAKRFRLPVATAGPHARCSARLRTKAYAASIAYRRKRTCKTSCRGRINGPGTPKGGEATWEPTSARNAFLLAGQFWPRSCVRLVPLLRSNCRRRLDLRDCTKLGGKW